MLNYLKSKIRGDKDVSATEQFYSPLRIALHSTVTVDSVDMVTLIGALHPLFIQPEGDFTVNAIGTLNMEGTKVYQVYMSDSKDEEFILQLVEGKDYRSGEAQVDEATLYKQVVTLEPETEQSLERYLSDIGFLTIDLDDIEYNRLWGDQFTEKLDFRTYEEPVVTPTKRVTYTNNYILYGRDIENITGDTVTEYLLVGLEENEDEAQIAMMVGLQLNISDIEVQ